MLHKIMIGLITVACIILLKMIFTPVPPPYPSNCGLVEGTVTKIFSPCCSDVLLKLEGHPQNYYINRGLDNDEVNIGVLESKILGRKVTLSVIQTNWTPLDPSGKLKPVARIQHQSQVVFDRFITEKKEHS